MTESKCIHVFVEGIVQGVFFRKSTVERASELGLIGWVRNLQDGRVEVLAEGEERSLLSLLNWLGKGPERARVSNLTIAWENPDSLAWPTDSDRSRFVITLTVP